MGTTKALDSGSWRPIGEVRKGMPTHEVMAILERIPQGEKAILNVMSAPPKERWVGNLNGWQFELYHPGEGASYFKGNRAAVALELQSELYRD